MRPLIKVLSALTIFAVFVVPPAASAAPATVAVPAAIVAPAAAVPIKVSTTLQALARLHSMGYTINTTARADRAIRAWQKANGLTIDGIVGPETLASLGLDKTDQQSPSLAKRRAPAAPSVDSSPPAVHEPGDVASIIRDVWPDDIEDWAVAIATREANLQPGARNACCWGLFQINWSAHRWLAGFGVTDPHQLLDPRVNATVALALFQQAGVGPWLCYGRCTDIPLP